MLVLSRGAVILAVLIVALNMNDPIRDSVLQNNVNDAGKHASKIDIGTYANRSHQHY